MNQTINASQGEADYFTAQVREVEKKDISTSAVLWEVALGGPDPDNPNDWPETWRDADLVEVVKPSVVKVSYFVKSSDSPVADRRLWVRGTEDGRKTVVVLTADRLDVK